MIIMMPDLKSLNIQNPNPLVYSNLQDGLTLQDIIVDGYNFKGWYTSQTGGTKVTQIKAGETGNKTLYAQAGKSLNIQLPLPRKWYL